MKDIFTFIFYELDLISFVLTAIVLRHYEIKLIRKNIAERLKNNIPFEFLTAQEKYKILEILKEFEK
jgi:hypothetical protein